MDYSTFNERFDNLTNTIKSQVENNELDAQTVLNSMQAIIAKLEKKEVKESTDFILGLISAGKNITVKACDGKATIAQAKKVFTGYIDPDFENWDLDKSGKATPETEAGVHEMQKNATFKQMFNSLNPDLDKLCWTQAQIISFAENNRDWLHPDGYATFFLFKCNNKYFVARVFWDSSSGELRVYVGHFDRGYVWYAYNRRRVIVPQLQSA